MGGRLDLGVELLSKPYSRETLARKVRQVMAKNNEAVIAMIRQFSRWLFRNRETVATTIAQGPNLVLWVVIAAGFFLWVFPNPTVALEIVCKGGPLVRAVDEVLRGVNPWRRCLGAAVFGYELIP
jgi:hypothetical protein